MIECLKADVVEQLGGNGALLLVGPVGLHLTVPEGEIDLLSEEQSEFLFTRVEITTEAMTIKLVAFATAERRQVYDALRRVSGVGVSTALRVLEAGRARDTLRAVAGQDHAFFEEIPGLGKKRIAAIFKELETAFAGALPKPAPFPMTVWVHARQMLMEAHPDWTVDQADKYLLATDPDQAGEHPDAEQLFAAVTSKI